MGRDLSPTTSLQIVLALCAVIAGLLVVSSVIGSVELLINSHAAFSVKFQERVSHLREFFKHRRIPMDVREEVISYIHHIWRKQRGIDDEQVLTKLPTETRAKIYRIM
jgi:hypothetical protein